MVSSSDYTTQTQSLSWYIALPSVLTIGHQLKNSYQKKKSLPLYHENIFILKKTSISYIRSICSNLEFNQHEFNVRQSTKTTMRTKPCFVVYHPNASTFSLSVISSRSNGTCLMFKNLNQAAIFLVMHFFFPCSSARFFHSFCILRHLLMNSDLIMMFFRMLFDICTLAISLWIIIFFFSYSMFYLCSLVIFSFVTQTLDGIIFNGIKKAAGKKCSQTGER